jgi:hypothetical protein
VRDVLDVEEAHAWMRDRLDCPFDEVLHTIERLRHEHSKQSALD